MIVWRKSSRSGGGSNGGNCVEVGAWRKSTRSGGSGNANCVEAGQLTNGTGIAVRDTKHRTGAVFTFTPVAWSGFVAGLKSGAFDL